MIETQGGTGKAYGAAVEQWDEDEAMVAAIVAELGGLDILVNNAGIASRGLTVEDTSADELQRVMEVHAFGPHYLTTLALPHLREHDRSDIVMISSTAAADLPSRSTPYIMAKNAMDALAFSLAKDLQDDGVRVNVVAPGLVSTDMGDRLVRATRVRDRATDLDSRFPFGRVARPEDIAAVVAFLVSEGGFYVSGQRIEVDGGGVAGRR
jgi:NAD(P)-dependent dehydrogenase (short-subunit alcohol dehydrogenase family)